jgi:predicted N-acetyltransferase YhbS
MSGLPLTKKAIVRPERSRDRARIEELLDLCFGADRLKKTAYRFREQVEPVVELSYVVAYEDETGSELDVAATIRYWPLLLPDDTPGLLLGPIAVDPALRNEGIGEGLMHFTLAQARAMGYASVILVGDAPYYQRFGFSRDVTLGLEMPGWVEESRFLGLEWVEGALLNQKGLLRKWPKGRLLPHYSKGQKTTNPVRS